MNKANDCFQHGPNGSNARAARQDFGDAAEGLRIVLRVSLLKLRNYDEATSVSLRLRKGKMWYK